MNGFCYNGIMKQDTTTETGLCDGFNNKYELIRSSASIKRIRRICANCRWWVVHEE